jgi:hypothetical protein
MDRNDEGGEDYPIRWGRDQFSVDSLRAEVNETRVQPDGTVKTTRRVFSSRRVAVKAAIAVPVVLVTVLLLVGFFAPDYVGSVAEGVVKALTGGP